MKCVIKIDNILLFVLFLIHFAAYVNGGTADGCLPLDPNCHPSCMVYDAARCRYCRPGCNNGYMGTSSSGGGSSWSSGGGSGSSDWDAKFSSNDWSAAVTGHQDAFSGNGNSGSSSGMSGFSSGGTELSGGNSYSGNGFSSGSSSGSGGFSNTGNSHTETVKYVYIEKEPEPSYSGSVYPDSSLLPGSFPGSGSPFLTPSMMGPGSGPSGPSSHSMVSPHGAVAHVPLLAPGVPKYCVRDKILGCPTTCERIDEWGCRSCPCAPARFQTMPVLVGGHQTVYTHHTAATSSREPSCPETLKCMLQCKDGYFLGDKMPNGCPSCRCLNKGAVGSSNGQGQKNGFQLQGSTTDPNSGGSSKWNSGNGMSNWNSGTGTGTGNSGTGSGLGSGSNNLLGNSNNGVGKGQCKPPLCADPNMSEHDAMELGKASASGGFGGGSGMGGAGMTSGGTSSGCKPPMCLGDGQTMGSLTGNYGGGSGSGSSASSGGCSGPFCASGNGMGMGSGGGSGMGSGSGGSGMPFSPFSSALSGSGAGSGAGSRPSMSGGSGGFGMPSAGSSKGSTDTSLEHKDCPGLLHCMVTCDGNYILGALDSTGCQSCSCS